MRGNAGAAFDDTYATASSRLPVYVFGANSVERRSQEGGAVAAGGEHVRHGGIDPHQRRARGRRNDTGRLCLQVRIEGLAGP